MKVVSVLGARPQFIKAAPVSRALAKAGAEECIVHTGQHYDANMSDLFFNEMGLPAPAYNLGISNLGHGAMTGRMLEQVEEVLLTEKPDCVLVYGDTNSTLAGALAAAKLHIPVAHVEAGLRSFNMQMPEEINRILTDRIAQVLFCPTDAAVANLEREGFRHFGVRIERTGDVMFDAALFYREKAMRRPFPKGIPGSGFVLATLHRAENTDDASRLRSLTEALGRVNAIAPVVMPLHPRTRARIKSLGWTLAGTVIDPVGYLDMLNLLDRCALVLTDSGGLQKEAYFFEKPCVTVRDQTEWTELVEAGVNKVVGASPSAILEAINTFISNPPRFTKGLYGDGSAAEVIARVLSSPG
jgi:UDP-GlcNAc3NAcA epimerase